MGSLCHINNITKLMSPLDPNDQLPVGIRLAVIVGMQGKCTFSAGS